MTEPAFASARPVLKVDGRQRDDLQEALTAMVVNLPLSGSAHAELHLTNWGRPQGATEPDYMFNDIGLGAGLEILMGSDSPASLFQGEVTGIEERYGEGAPGLALLLQDKLHRLARARHSRSYADQSPDDVVQAVAGDAGLQPDAGVSGLIATWNQVNESDLAFLLRLLDRFDIALRLDGGRLRARPEEPDPNPLPLDAQDSALRVRLVVDLNHQPARIKVQGYNAAEATDVDHTAGSLSPPPPGTGGADTLGNLGWSGDEIVPQPFPRSSAEAQAYAEAHFRREAKRFVHGDIVCQGEASLKSGREIELSGVSPRLAGTYRVVHCVHRFDGVSGYETHLTVHKAGWQP
jgi:phage protein D